MICNYIASQMYANFTFEPTLEQKNLINLLSDYIINGETESIFMINGYAGTGKTTIIASLVTALSSAKITSTLMAPTGRAAKVMSQYCNCAAFTIHKKIYRQKVVGAENSKFSLNINKNNNMIYIVDEASMLSNNGGDTSIFGSGHLIDDLIEYVNMGSDNRLIIVGDDAQLPPIGLDFSPALNPLQMGGYGEIHYSTLSEVVRQAAQSGILRNATTLRNDIETQTVNDPCFNLEVPDVIRINGSELIEALEDSYSRYGKENTIVVTRSNKRANQYNQGIRRTILDYEEQINSGDMLMVVKNNYFWVDKEQNKDFEFVANGDVAIVRRIQKTKEIYGFRYGYMTLEFPDYDNFTMDCWVLLDTLHSDAPSLTREQSSLLFNTIEQDYASIGNKRARYRKIMENEYFNALQVKFAYAVTCHKAQGGQWSSVFIDQLLFGQEQMTREFQRWLYTAITRAQTRLYLVNWSERFFINK